MLLPGQLKGEQQAHGDEGRGPEIEPGWPNVEAAENAADVGDVRRHRERDHGRTGSIPGPHPPGRIEAEHLHGQHQDDQGLYQR